MHTYSRLTTGTMVLVLVMIIPFSLLRAQETARITPDNAAQLIEVGVLGYGYATDVAWSPDGHTLAVAASGGVLLYDTFALDDTPQHVQVDQANSVIFSPDGHVMAFGGHNGIHMLNMVNGQDHTIVLNEEDAEVIGLAFSPDGTILASGSSGDTVSLWDVKTGERLAALIGSQRGVTEVAFSADGQLLASAGGYDDGMTGNDGLIRLWNVMTNERLSSIGGNTKRLTGVAFSPDGLTLASGSYDNAVYLWNVSTGEMVTRMEGHTGDVVSVAFSPDGTTLASSGGWEDSMVRFWNVETGESLGAFEGCVRQAHTGEMGALAFSPDGRILASTCSIDGVMLWDISTGGSHRLSQGYNGPVHNLVFSPDGTTLAFSGMYAKTIHLWDTENRKAVTELSGHTDWIWSLDFSPDGTTLASGSQDRTVRLWDTTTGSTLLVLEGLDDAVSGTAHHSDEDGDVNQSVEMFSDIVRSVDFHPDGSIIAVGRADPFGVPGSFQLYDVATGEMLADVRPQHSRVPLTAAGVSYLTFSPNGAFLATALGDCTVRLWDVDTHQEHAVLKAETDNFCASSVVFNPHGTILAGGGAWSDCGWSGQVCNPEKGEIYLWNVAAGDQVGILAEPMRGVQSMAFSPDGHLLAAVTYDGVIHLWDVMEGRLVVELDSRMASSVAFSPDGTIVAAGSWEGTVRLWGIPQ